MLRTIVKPSFTNHENALIEAAQFNRGSKYWMLQQYFIYELKVVESQPSTWLTKHMSKKICYSALEHILEAATKSPSISNLDTIIHNAYRYISSSSFNLIIKHEISINRTELLYRIHSLCHIDYDHLTLGALTGLSGDIDSYIYLEFLKKNLKPKNQIHLSAIHDCLYSLAYEGPSSTFKFLLSYNRENLDMSLIHYNIILGKNYRAIFDYMVLCPKLTVYSYGIHIDFLIEALNLQIKKGEIDVIKSIKSHATHDPALYEKIILISIKENDFHLFYLILYVLQINLTPIKEQALVLAIDLKRYDIVATLLAHTDIKLSKGIPKVLEVFRINIMSLCKEVRIDIGLNILNTITSDLNSAHWSYVKIYFSYLEYSKVPVDEFNFYVKYFQDRLDTIKSNPDSFQIDEFNFIKIYEEVIAQLDNKDYDFNYSNFNLQDELDIFYKDTLKKHYLKTLHTLKPEMQTSSANLINLFWELHNNRVGQLFFLYYQNNETSVCFKLRNYLIHYESSKIVYHSKYTLNVSNYIKSSADNNLGKELVKIKDILTSIQIRFRRVIEISIHHKKLFDIINCIPKEGDICQIVDFLEKKVSDLIYSIQSYFSPTRLSSDSKTYSISCLLRSYIRCRNTSRITYIDPSWIEETVRREAILDILDSRITTISSLNIFSIKSYIRYLQSFNIPLDEISYYIEHCRTRICNLSTLTEQPVTKEINELYIKTLQSLFQLSDPDYDLRYEDENLDKELDAFYLTLLKKYLSIYPLLDEDTQNTTARAILLLRDLHTYREFHLDRLYNSDETACPFVTAFTVYNNDILKKHASLIKVPFHIENYKHSLTEVNPKKDHVRIKDIITSIQIQFKNHIETAYLQDKFIPVLKCIPMICCLDGTMELMRTYVSDLLNGKFTFANLIKKALDLYAIAVEHHLNTNLKEKDSPEWYIRDYQDLCTQFDVLSQNNKPLQDFSVLNDELLSFLYHVIQKQERDNISPDINAASETQTFDIPSIKNYLTSFLGFTDEGSSKSSKVLLTQDELNKAKNTMPNLIQINQKRLAEKANQQVDLVNIVNYALVHRNRLP